MKLKNNWQLSFDGHTFFYEFVAQGDQLNTPGVFKSTRNTLLKWEP
jgi:hypothetical protein